MESKAFVPSHKLEGIWKELEEIWTVFSDYRPKDFREWEKLEGLDGLLSSLSNEGAMMEVLSLNNLSQLADYDSVETTVIASLIAGIRMGYELAQRRKDGV